MFPYGTSEEDITKIFKKLNSEIEKLFDQTSSLRCCLFTTTGKFFQGAVRKLLSVIDFHTFQGGDESMSFMLEEKVKVSVIFSS